MNKLSFSFSRKGSFDSCKRSYYLNYYGSKNGWFKNSPKRTQEIYYLKKTSNIWAWAGTVVHDVLEWVLKELRDKQRIVTEQEARARAKDIVLNGFTESQRRVQMWNNNEWGWKDLFGLTEHAKGEQIPAKTRGYVADRIRKSLTHFFSSQIYQKILKSNPSEWKAIENFSTYDIELSTGYSIPVFSVPDFAMKFQNKLYIFDWKTGKVNDKYKDQLALYAVYAEMYWDVVPEDIICEIFYLKLNEVVQVNIDKDTINKMIRKIQEGSLEMIEYLKNKDPVKNVALEESKFSLSPSENSCKWCPFSSVCGANK